MNAMCFHINALKTGAKRPHTCELRIGDQFDNTCNANTHIATKYRNMMQTQHNQIGKQDGNTKNKLHSQQVLQEE